MHFKISAWNGLFLALVNSYTSVKEIKKNRYYFQE